MYNVYNSETSKAIPCGKISSNYNAEATALSHAISEVSKPGNQTSKIAFFSDCKSVLQSIKGNSSDRAIIKIHNALSHITKKSQVVIQWIPAHCGIRGNEKADTLSKAGSKMEQPLTKVTYGEARSLIKNTLHSVDRQHRKTIQ